MLVSSFYLYPSGDWKCFFTTPDAEFLSLGAASEGQVPVKFQSITNYDSADPWISVDKWMIRLVSASEELHNLPGLRVVLSEDGSEYFLVKIGRTLIKMDSDGPFNMEEPAWDAAYAFVEPE